MRTLGHETAKAVRELEQGTLDNQPTSAIGAWFARFRNRLIARGVGYVTAKVEERGSCWAGAFPHVTDCAETRMQMRRLDRFREGLLAKVVHLLPARYRRKGRYFKGRPFSYYGYLERAARPTNMAYRRETFLPYSEL